MNMREKFPKWTDPPVHPANTAPMMSTKEIDELAADIKKHCLQEPIIYWRDNSEAANGSEGPFPLFLLDGRNRREALKRLGNNDPRQAKLGSIVASTMRILNAIKQTGTLGSGGKVSSKWVTDCDPNAFHLSLNVYRRHLTPEQKRWEIKRQIAADPLANNQDIARKFGVARETVRDGTSETAVRGFLKRATSGGKRREFALPDRAERRLQGSREFAAWLVKHARREELPTILTWLRGARLKTVISKIKAHMGEE